MFLTDAKRRDTGVSSVSAMAAGVVAMDRDEMDDREMH